MNNFEEPLADRLYNTVFGGLGSDATADRIGLGVLVATGIGIAAHAAIQLSKILRSKYNGEKSRSRSYYQN